MPKIALVTDSTAYIPQELVDKYHITVIPQVLVWGSDTFRDGVDIQPNDFYARLQKASHMPSTSQATPAAFEKIYRQLLDDDYQVLAVLLAAKLSGTMASAIQALESFPDAPIEVYDSNTTAMALGFMVLEAARAAEQGASMRECLQLLDQLKGNNGVFLTVATLEFLHRGGRIGGATRLLGTALNIKPILELKDGRIEPLERVRTRSKALQQIIELTVNAIGDRRPVHIAALHANAEGEACLVLDQLNMRIETVESLIASVSPVVGTHVGPGTVGLAYLIGV